MINLKSVNSCVIVSLIYRQIRALNPLVYWFVVRFNKYCMWANMELIEGVL